MEFKLFCFPFSYWPTVLLMNSRKSLGLILHFGSYCWGKTKPKLLLPNIKETLILEDLIFYSSPLPVCCPSAINSRIIHAHIQAHIKIQLFSAHQTVWCSGWIENHRSTDMLTLICLIQPMFYTLYQTELNWLLNHRVSSVLKENYEVPPHSRHDRCVTSSCKQVLTSCIKPIIAREAC